MSGAKQKIAPKTKTHSKKAGTHRKGPCKKGSPKKGHLDIGYRFPLGSMLFGCPKVEEKHQGGGGGGAFLLQPNSNARATRNH